MSDEIYVALGMGVYVIAHPVKSPVIEIYGTRYAIGRINGSSYDDGVSNLYGRSRAHVPLRRVTLTLDIVEIPRESPKPAKRRWATSTGPRKPNG